MKRTSSVLPVDKALPEVGDTKGNEREPGLLLYHFLCLTSPLFPYRGGVSSACNQ